MRDRVEQYERSRQRLSSDLQRATAYRDIVVALRSEILEVLGFRSVWLQLLRTDADDILMLDADGPVETSIRALMRDDRYCLEINGERFLLIPLEGDAFLGEIIDSDDVFVVEDAQLHPASNKEMVGITGNRTMVCLPLVGADGMIGCLSMGTFFAEGVLVPDDEQLDYVRSLALPVATALSRVNALGEPGMGERGEGPS